MSSEPAFRQPLRLPPGQRENFASIPLFRANAADGGRVGRAGRLHGDGQNFRGRAPSFVSSLAISMNRSPFRMRPATARATPSGSIRPATPSHKEGATKPTVAANAVVSEVAPHHRRQMAMLVADRPVTVLPAGQENDAERHQRHPLEAVAQRVHVHQDQAEGIEPVGRLGAGDGNQEKAKSSGHGYFPSSGIRRAADRSDWAQPARPPGAPARASLSPSGSSRRTARRPARRHRRSGAR